MKLNSTFEIRQNLHIVARSRGKIVARRDGHNIWLNTGREFIAQLMAYSLMSPLTTIRNDRIRYIGLGIGGTRQRDLARANASPLVTHYPGTNAQTDQDPLVTGIERPVRLSGTSTTPPYNAFDVWLGQIQAPPEYPQYNRVVFRRLFQSTEVSYNPYNAVPLSEVGLFTNAADPLLPGNTAVAYDTFDTLTKTEAVEIEMEWTLTT